jgi:hypothetical protein
MNTAQHFSPMARTRRPASLAQAGASIAWIVLLSVLSLPLIFIALAASVRAH